MAPVQELLKYRNDLSETTALPVQELPVQELPVQELPVRQAGPVADLSGGCSGSGLANLLFTIRRLRHDSETRQHGAPCWQLFSPCPHTSHITYSISHLHLHLHLPHLHLHGHRSPAWRDGHRCDRGASPHPLPARRRHQRGHHEAADQQAAPPAERLCR